MRLTRIVTVQLVLFSLARLSAVRVDSIGKFTIWCADNGIVGLQPSGPISVAATPGSGLGLFAADNVGVGKEILRIPARLAIADRLLIGIDGKAPKAPFDGAPWQATLAHRLAVADTAWTEMLPLGVQGLEGPGEDLQYKPAIAAHETIRTERSELAARLAACGPADAATYERGVSYAHTRAFLLELIPDDAFAACHAFVPAADLFNHAAYAESAVEWCLEGGGGDGNPLSIVFSTRRPVSKGEELSLCYEPSATNDDFCLYHGFVPAANPCDDVELFAGVDDAIRWHREAFESEPSEEAAAAAAMLGAMPPMDGSVHMRRVGVASGGPLGEPLWIRADEIDARLLGVFRVLAAEVKSPRDDDDDPAKHAATALVRRCDELLASWPTSLESDLALLNCAPSEVNAAISVDWEGAPSKDDDAARAIADGAGAGESVAVRYRAGKKLVLRAASAWVRERWGV